MAEKTQFDYLWDKIRERAERLINPLSYERFIRGLEPVDVMGGTLVLRAEDELVAATVSRHHLTQLREAIASADVGLSDVALIVDGSEEYSIDKLPDTDAGNAVALDPRYTFDSFVVGSSNKFVYAAAKSVANNPGGEYNPLYIYGGTGLGKTHLMQAIANEIREKKPSLKVLYTTSEKFLNEFVDSLARKGEGREFRFRNRYRNVDVLLIDDIQFWAGKYGVQEAFFHTFNELSSQNKQIVISSDCPAKELTTLEERLRTRFEGGLIADIQPPDLETKIAILKRKALEKKYVVPDDVLAFLAKNSDNNVRTLEGKLNTVIFASKLHEEPITLKLAGIALQEAINVDENAVVTPDTIVRATCAHFSITKQELLGKSKRAELVRARQICTYLMCDMLALPLVSVGKEMGGRDHATVIYSRDKVASLMKVSDAMAKDVNDIKSAVLKQ